MRILYCSLDQVNHTWICNDDISSLSYLSSPKWTMKGCYWRGWCDNYCPSRCILSGMVKWWWGMGPSKTSGRHCLQPIFWSAIKFSSFEISRNGGLSRSSHSIMALAKFRTMSMGLMSYCTGLLNDMYRHVLKFNLLESVLERWVNHQCCSTSIIWYFACRSFLMVLMDIEVEVDD